MLVTVAASSRRLPTLNPARLRWAGGVMLTQAGRSARPGGSRVCTLYDVAREAGVSTATVSRVVHGQDRVRMSTRQRVLDVIEALGYVPDSAAQSMARHRKDLIGLVALENRSKAAPRILTDDQLADYQLWFDNHRRLRELIAELEALTLAIAEADPRWKRGPAAAQS